MYDEVEPVLVARDPDKDAVIPMELLDEPMTPVRFGTGGEILVELAGMRNGATLSLEPEWMMKTIRWALLPSG